MANIVQGSLIKKLEYVQYFNEKVWGQISSAAGGNIYHNGSAVTLSQDNNISIKAAPKFSSVAYSGNNTTKGSILYNKPNAIPTSNKSGVGGNGVPHLKTLSGNVKQHFTLSTSDIDAKATALGKNPSLIVADAIYSCCFDVIRALISIRPFKSTWKHDSSVANRKINESFNGGKFAYGVFVDNPSTQSSWEKVTGSGTWNKGASLSKWQVTLGGSISKLKLTEASVARTGVYVNSVAAATRTTTMVSNFWNAWSERCRGKNAFDYKFFSCHLNCHSSCHSSCHGSRSRR